MLSLITAPIKPYMTVIKIAMLAILIASAVGFAKLYFDKLEDAAKLEQSLILEAEKVRLLQESITSAVEQQKLLQEERVVIIKEFHKEKETLNEFRGRQSVVSAKPKLVEKKIQTSFDAFVVDVQCITGNDEKCSK